MAARSRAGTSKEAAGKLEEAAAGGLLTFSEIERVTGNDLT
jgi:hypothetical protein